MAIASLPFLLLILVLGATYFWLPGTRARQAVFFLCSLGFIASHLPNFGSAGFLSAFLLSGYGIGLLMRRRPNGWALTAYLCGLVLCYMMLQRYSVSAVVFGAWVSSHEWAVVGISYMLFRQIHFLVDCLQGQVPNVSLWAYLSYQINFLALVAGPIQRFQDFAAYWAEPRPCLEDRHALLATLFRLSWGIVCVVGISTALSEVHTSLQQSLAAVGSGGAGAASASSIVLKVAALIYVYPLYMYFNFAGYCHIVIAAAALLGLRLPENFDRPYLARNILDFWARWHQSLGFWVRDYLFTPMVMALAKWNAKAASTWAFGCYFVAFVVMGIWHGTGIGFLIFGLLHGLGGSAAKIWETMIVKRRGRKGLRAYLEMTWIRRLAVFGTLTYFSLSLLFFSNTLDKFMIPWRALQAIWVGG